MGKTVAPILVLTSVFLFFAASTTSAQNTVNQAEPTTSESAVAKDLITFSKSWLTISYPKSFKFKDEFRGESNYIEIDDRTTKGHLFMYYQPLVNITYDKMYQARCDPDSPRFRGPKTKVIRTGDHSIYPGAKETLSSMKNPQGFSCYWCIMAPVDGYVLEINISELVPTEAEIQKAMRKWEQVVDSIKIAPDQAVFTKWDGIERFRWDGASPATFSYTFSPDFGFIAFHDSSATPVLKFTNGDFQQSIAKSKRSATFFMSDALTIPATFYFNEKWPDPTGPDWTNVVEGIMTVKSGELVFGAGTTPKEAAITLPKGVYKFRVYSAPVDSENDSQEVRFYFNLTEEKETNKIVVLKRTGR